MLKNPEPTTDTTAIANLKQAGPPRHASNYRVYAIDEDKQLKLVTHIENGCSNREACRIVGVKEDTFKDWLKRGRADDAEDPYKTFADEVEKAEAKAVYKAEAAINSAFDKDWKAAAWYLARKRPEQYADKPSVALATTGNVSIYLPDNGRDAVLPEATDDGAAS